jgi:hypothetical protein
MPERQRSGIDALCAFLARLTPGGRSMDDTDASGRPDLESLARVGPSERHFVLAASKDAAWIDPLVPDDERSKRDENHDGPNDLAQTMSRD